MSWRFNRAPAAAGMIVAFILADAGASGRAAAAIDIVVPDEFPTITLAVRDGTDIDGDGTVHIFVRGGSYADNVLIQQRADLVLEGEDNATTVIVGTGTAPTVEIQGCLRVAVTNFTITGDGSGDGVKLSQSEICLVTDNIIQQNDDGIVLSSAGGSTVQDNLVQLNGGTGIVLSGSDGNEVRFNTILKNQGSGISLSQSGANLIEVNRVQVNAGYGLRVQTGNFNVIRANQLFRSGNDGLRIQNASQTLVRENAIYRNSGNGIRMNGTSNSVVSRNAITSNVKFGVIQSNTSNDDWNPFRNSVQNPPGDNRVVGNRAGNVK